MHLKYPKIDQILVFFPLRWSYKNVHFILQNKFFTDSKFTFFISLNKLQCIIQFKKINKMQSLLILHF